MHVSDIHSVGWLHNHNGSIALTISIKGEIHPVYVSISTEEFEAAGGREGLNENKQRAIDFYNKYGAGRHR